MTDMTSIEIGPRFIQRLLNILKDRSNRKFISWNRNGTTVLIKNRIDFERVVLVKYFKIANLNSFIRQLNKYNFRKVEPSEKTIAKYRDNLCEFYNPNFKRNVCNVTELKPMLKKKAYNRYTQARDMESAIKVITKFFHIITDEIDYMRGILERMRRRERSFDICIFSKDPKLVSFVSAVAKSEHCYVEAFNSFGIIVKNLRAMNGSLLFIGEDNGCIFDLLRFIKRRCLNISVVVLCHSVDKKKFVKYLDEGANEIVLKPYEKDILVDLICKYKLSANKMN